MTLIMLGGCASGSRDSYCLLYHPVYTSRTDTPETRAQADGNNAVWLTLCGQAVASRLRDQPQ